MADEKKDSTGKNAVEQKPSAVKPEQAKKEPSKDPEGSKQELNRREERGAQNEQAQVAKEPVKAAPAPAPVQAPAPAPAAAGLQLNPDDQVLLTTLINRVDAYCAAMKPRKPINPKIEGAKQQKDLFKIIDQILCLPGPLFNVAWTRFLAQVKEHRNGVFHEKYAFRFLEHTKLEPKVVMNYRNLIHLAIHTADPAGRKQMLKLINIELVCQNLTPNQRLADAANKLYGYYHDPL